MTAEPKQFKSAAAWEKWLAKNHASSPGIWLRLARKASGVKSITHAQALDAALCYGWIDAQVKRESETFWNQRFMPRTRRSIWSKINREKALALIAAGKMKPAGLAEVERAQQDGRWDQAYDSPKTATVPVDLQAALDASPKAAVFFKTLNSANRYAILFRVNTAKRAETRERRITAIIKMLENGETYH